MPIISSPYSAKGLFKNGHFSTIYSAKLRPIPKVIQERERLELSDGDFVDIDWSFSEQKSTNVAILLHGLEGNAQRVIAAADEARRLLGADLVLFPELMLTGYPPEDLLLRPSLNSRVDAALADIGAAISVSSCNEKNGIGSNP